MRRIQEKTPPKYRASHPLAGDVLCDNWMEFCDKAVSLAEQEAQKQLYDELVQLTIAIADEIIESAYPVHIEDAEETNVA